MKREKAERELAKVRKQIAECQAKEKEYEEIIREANKEEAAAIMGKYKISVGELDILLKEHKAEIQRMLEEKRKKEIEDETNKKETYQNKTDADC